MSLNHENEPRQAIIAPPDDIAIVAALAASVASGSATIDLAVPNTAQAKRLSDAFETLGLTKVTCATWEELIFGSLRGDRIAAPTTIVADSDGSLLRDADTPVILAMPHASGVESVTESSDAAPLLRDRDYVVQGGEIVVRDPDTGNLLPGHRFSNGMHSALERREGLPLSTAADSAGQTTLRDYLRSCSRLIAIVPTADDRYRTEYGLAFGN